MKRKRLYKGYSLGAKLFGKKACIDAGEACWNYNSEVGLINFCDEKEGLKELCKRIQEVSSKRNRFMHGLITTVVNDTYVIHNKTPLKLEEAELWKIRNELIDIIEKLNQLIPIPGLHATWATGPSVDVYYDVLALSADDPIVNLHEK